MYSCEIPERLRLLQFADTLRACEKIHPYIHRQTKKYRFDDEFKKPNYIKTEWRWRAMIKSVLNENTQYDNNQDFRFAKTHYYGPSR